MSRVVTVAATQMACSWDRAAIARFREIAAELKVVLPISFFERAGRARFSSVAIIDADGSNLGVYRKSHIPDGPGYHEKYYFNPGNTGSRVWDTAYAVIGVGICWDQWFPECARSMALMGAEILFYPTAIGREAQDGYDITFYGSSFIANQFGEIVEQLNQTEEGMLVHSFDLDELEQVRTAWGVFRDRRPNLYRPIATLDGETPSE